jgi:hypothetical protein
MSATPWVSQLRTRDGVVAVGAPSGDDVLHLRVEMASAWDAIRVDAMPGDSVRAVKLNALEAFAPGALFPDEFVIKLRGHEILDEAVSLADAGAVDGSIFLVAHRYRRPVR